MAPSARIRVWCSKGLDAMRINWKEVCKFLSGAFFVSAGVNAYFYFTHLAVPFLGFTISPELLGLRSIIHFVLFLLCFYFGFIRK
jgi:hypothetical protein